VTDKRGNRVGVIGAGIAGLVTAKVLRDDGFDVIVFEKEPSIGGVWAESRAYPGLRTNNSRETYSFSDHPYDASADVFPTAEQVRKYLASYVARFGLAPLIRLSSEVVKVARGQTGFDVAVLCPHGPATERCDLVVVCAGTFCEPLVPEIEGADGFAGTLVHSSQADDPALFTDRRVVVVGAGKSALDCAVWAGSHAQSCTLVFRAPHWMGPRYLPARIPFDQLGLTRLTELFFRYHRLSRAERFLHGSGRLLTRLFWRATSRLFRLLLRMPAVMVPDEPLPAGIENVGVGQEFFDMARGGVLGLRRDAIAAFSGGTELLLASGERIDADLVIFATGWRQSLTFLAPELRSAVLDDGHFQLYRHILPPTEHELGFVGYASSFACQFTSEVSAHWLSQCFRGELTLPAVDEMQAEVSRVRAWLADVLPARPEGYMLGPYLAHHIDELVADMGLPTRRTSNFLAEHVGRFLPARYRDLGEERRLARGGHVQHRRQLYLSAGHAIGGLAALTLADVVRRHGPARRSHRV
jgi:dimethylaniline monooxygenase (N-oxide forming)